MFWSQFYCSLIEDFGKVIFFLYNEDVMTCLADLKILLTMKRDLKHFVRYGIGIHNLRQLLKNI